MLRSTERRRRWAGLLLLLSVAESLALASPLRLAINEGDAAAALKRFSQLTKIQVLYRYQEIKGARTRAIDTLGAHQALDSMLAGSPLRYQFLNPIVVVVWRQPIPPTTSEVTIRTGRASNHGLSLEPNTLIFSPDEVQGVGQLSTADWMDSFTQQTGVICDDGFDSGSREGRSNSARACGLNWHGTGWSRMLVLVDGKRRAGSGTGGLFTNTTQIPSSAVERVEIAPDSSSGRYGSEAVGGVANFRLRRDFVGAETRLVATPAVGSASWRLKLSQLLGSHWGALNWVIGLDYICKDAVPASRRAEGTSNLTPFGGNDFSWPYGDPGTIVLPSGSYAIPVLPEGSILSPRDFTKRTPNLYDTRVGTDLLPRTRTVSGFALGTFDLGVGDLKTDALVTQRQVEDNTTPVGLPLTMTSANPYYFNPTGGTEVEQIQYGFLHNLGPTVLHDNVVDGTLAVEFSRNPDDGIIADVFVAHSFERLREAVDGVVNPSGLEAAVTSSLPEHALDPYQDGITTSDTWRSIRGQSFNGSTSTLTQIAAMAESDLLWRSRLIDVTVGVDWRREALGSISKAAGSTSIVHTSEGRDVTAGFAAVCIPITGLAPHMCNSSNRRDYPGGRDTSRYLDLEVSARYEHYSDIRAHMTPTASLTWRVFAPLVLNGTWSRSSHPGGLSDLSGAKNDLLSAPLPDARSSSGYSQTLVVSGSNPQLGPETAQSFTFTAQWVPNRTFAARSHLFYINLNNMIDAPTYSSNALNDPNFSNYVVWKPTASQLTDVCSRSDYVGGIAACIASPVDAIVDLRLHNVARVVIDGIDLMLRRVWEDSWGRWAVGLDATYIDRYAITQDGVVENVVNRVGRPLRYKSHGTVGWYSGHWSAMSSLAYKGGYRDTTSEPNRSIRSWTVVDFEVGWQTLASSGSAWANIRLSAGVHNLFQRTPPFVNNAAGLGYDPSNADQLGRFFSFGFVKAFGQRAAEDRHIWSIPTDSEEDL